MKKITFIAILTSSWMGAQTYSLDVSISGLESNDGKVKIGLYNSESSFLKTTYKTAVSEINGKTATVTFGELPKGDYAISLYHDENNNGILDRNMFGIPSEDYASSNNAKGTMGPPSYGDAKFTVNANSKIRITLNN